jgi:hypothetical protein
MKHQKKNPSFTELRDLQLRGPYPLNAEQIDAVIRVNSCGNYAIGELEDRTHLFIPELVGRSDDDLANQIKRHIGQRTNWTHFMADYAPSPKAAYEKECKNYHHFKDQLWNMVHPSRPPNVDWICPDCPPLEEPQRSSA